MNFSKGFSENSKQFLFWKKMERFIGKSTEPLVVEDRLKRIGRIVSA
jgi:hypothetical protein